MGIARFIFLVCFLSSAARARKATCGFPGAPAYGYVRPESVAYSEGDMVFFQCGVGHILIGSPISRCTEDGSWTEDVPICDDSMTTLGVADSTPTVPGHAAELAIDRDKETCSYLKPKKPRWWRIDLGAEHKVLSVAVTMITPDKYVKFTVYVIKTQGTSASYKRCAFFSGKFGTPTVVLSCAEGKGIEGQTIHIEDHNPTDGLFEICEVEVQVEKDTGYDCGKPSHNLYSTTFEHPSVSSAFPSVFDPSDMVEYGCIKGYELKGSVFRKCQSSGQWTGEPPECIPIICDDLESLENGEIRLSHSNNGPALEGALAIYKCNEGYKLDGSFTRNCLNDGSWSGNTPQCKAIRCPIPESKGGMYRLLNKTNSMGSMAMLRCREGKREGDNPYIICTEDGEWTQPQAHCIIPAKYVEPRIANRGAVIFGMVVAAIMIVVVCVSIYLYGLKKRNVKPELPSRLSDPLVPPPRPPPRAFKAAFMGFMKEEPGWRKQVYSTVPEENEDASLENVVVDNRVSDSSPIPPKDSAGVDYAAVDYEKKRQSRLLKDQDSSSSAGASPIPTDEPNKSPSPPKAATPSEESEEEEESEDEVSSVKEASEDDRKAKEEEERKAQEEEERKAKEEEERKEKEEEERKAKEEEERKAKEEEEKKAKEEEEKKKAAEAPGRRRRIRDEPAPEPEDKPVLRRFRRT